MFKDIMLGMFSFSLVLIPIIGYFAVKNQWRIIKWF